jgi:hypothetical protein
VAEAAGVPTRLIQGLAGRESDILRGAAGTLDIERAEALILEVARECARCPVNRRCPQSVCRYWRVEQEAQAVLEAEGIPSPTHIERAVLHETPDGETAVPA